MISWTIIDRQISRYDLPRLKTTDYTRGPIEFLRGVITDMKLTYLHETSYIHAFYCAHVNDRVLFDD